MITIGNPESFAVELYSNDSSSELAEVFLIVAGQRVSGNNPIYVPTFCAQLSAFLKIHEAVKFTNKFSAMSYVAVFQLFHQVSETDQNINGVSPDDVWHYHRFHSIDEAVDGWEIYIYDTNDQKNIVCKDLHKDENCISAGLQIIGSTLPRSEYIETLAECIEVLNKKLM